MKGDINSFHLMYGRLNFIHRLHGKIHFGPLPFFPLVHSLAAAAADRDMILGTSAPLLPVLSVGAIQRIPSFPSLSPLLFSLTENYAGFGHEWVMRQKASCKQDKPLQSTVIFTKYRGRRHVTTLQNVP